MATHRDMTSRSARSEHRVARVAFRAGISATVVGALLVVPLLPASAVTVPLGTYAAALPTQPFSVPVNASHPASVRFPVTFTNTSPNGYLLSAVHITLPTGFSAIGGASINVAGWSTSVSGNTVSASSSSPLTNGIASAGTGVLSFTANPPFTAGTYTFASAAQGIVASTGVAGDFSNSGREPTVAITNYTTTYKAALPSQPYSLLVSTSNPAIVSFPVTFTNTSSSGYPLSAVHVTLPSGFNSVGGASINVAGWSASVSGNTVTASTSAPASNGIPAAGTGVLSFTAKPPTAAGTYPLTSATEGTLANGATGSFSNSGSEPVVAVSPYGTVVTCSPSQACDTGTVGTPTDTQARIVTSTGSSQDTLGVSVQPATDQSCLGLMHSAGHSQEVTFRDTDLSRTLTQTLRLDHSIAISSGESEDGKEGDASDEASEGSNSYGICYDTAGNTSHTTFVDRHGHVVTAGFLPLCSTGGLPAGNPCITSITRNETGDVLITFTAPGGDPHNIAGIPLF